MLSLPNKSIEFKTKRPRASAIFELKSKRTLQLTIFNTLNFAILFKYIESIILLSLNLCEFVTQFLILNLIAKVPLIKINIIKTKTLRSSVEVAGDQHLLNHGTAKFSINSENIFHISILFHLFSLLYYHKLQQHTKTVPKSAVKPYKVKFCKKTIYLFSLAKTVQKKQKKQNKKQNKTKKTSCTLTTVIWKR